MVMRKYLRHTKFLLLFLLIFSLAGFVNEGTADSVSRISVDQVKQMLDQSDTVIIDVRKPRNWWRTRYKVLTAAREDPSQVDQWARKYTKDQTLIFY